MVGVAEIDAKDQQAVITALAKLPEPTDLATLTKAGTKRWDESITTKLERGNDANPFTVDTLTIPYKNRFGALFFCTGLDFLKDGRIAVCTCHGDVWLVTVDEKRKMSVRGSVTRPGCTTRSGLKVIDEKVIVLERGQLTRLHDLNNDGEADFYECVNNDWHTGGGEHSYDTCLETDPQGNFYFFKTGDTETPHRRLFVESQQGPAISRRCIARGSATRSGMGISPKGIITGADQEGNWMPATRIDEYKTRRLLRRHAERITAKLRRQTYDAPLCWLPREVDNSAGGQVWVPEKTPSARSAGCHCTSRTAAARRSYCCGKNWANGRTQGGCTRSACTVPLRRVPRTLPLRTAPSTCVG